MGYKMNPSDYGSLLQTSTGQFKRTHLIHNEQFRKALKTKIVEHLAPLNEDVQLRVNATIRDVKASRFYDFVGQAAVSRFKKLEKNRPFQVRTIDDIVTYSRISTIILSVSPPLVLEFGTEYIMIKTWQKSNLVRKKGKIYHYEYIEQNRIKEHIEQASMFTSWVDSAKENIEEKIKKKLQKMNGRITMILAPKCIVLCLVKNI